MENAQNGSIDQLFTGSINMFILWLLALSSLFVVAEFLGFLPERLSKWINRNRLRETIRLLEELGVDVETSKRSNRVAGLEQVAQKDLEGRVAERLNAARIAHPVNVGDEIDVPSDYYIDLMGLTADLRAASVFARDLVALWRSLAGVGGMVAAVEIDFVVGPKTGSPLLAARFAELLNKPLLLHNPKPKFRSDPDDPKAYFDCHTLPEKGSRGLMVDDSSTGGGKAVRLIDDLRRFNWEVNDFLVVFEPQLKTATGQNAATRLQPKGVKLHSIIKT